MEQCRRDLRAGEENKSAFVQPGMGKRQGPGLENQVIVKKEIEVEGAFCPTFTPYPPVLLLNRLQKLQQIQRRENGGNRDDRIQIKSLSTRSTAGLTFVQGRNSEAVNPRCRTKVLPCRQQMGMAVTKVGTESDIGARIGGRDGNHGEN